MVGEQRIDSGGTLLSVSQEGAGTPVVLLHGLTATRRYVVMGSRALERSGHRVIAYDARGHGGSDPGAGDARTAYGYPKLVGDLVAVLDRLGIAQALLAGASMGAHTALALALTHPERVGGLVVITPAYEPARHDDPERLKRWDALAGGMRRAGVEGFLAAYGRPQVPAEWQETVIKVIRQRLALHEHPEAVADALEGVPRSRPFGAVKELSQIGAPTAIIASSDVADPGHPQAVGEAYAAAIPGARLVLDEPGRSPVAWQGSQVSRVISEIAAQLSAG